MKVTQLLFAFAVLALVGLTGFVLAALVVGGLGLPGLGRSGLAMAGTTPADYGWTVMDIDSGESIDVGQYRGEVLVIKVWATWCPPCVAEMPSMQAMYDQLEPEGLKVLAVSVDDSNLPVKQFLEREGITMPVVMTGGWFPPEFETTAIPTSFILSRDGVIVDRHVGSREWDNEEMLAKLRELLAQPKP